MLEEIENRKQEWEKMEADLSEELQDTQEAVRC